MILSKKIGNHQQPLKTCFCKFIEITLVLHGCSPVNWFHIFRTPCPINTSGRLLLRYNQLENIFSLLYYISC